MVCQLGRALGPAPAITAPLPLLCSICLGKRSVRCIFRVVFVFSSRKWHAHAWRARAKCSRLTLRDRAVVTVSIVRTGATQVAVCVSLGAAFDLQDASTPDLRTDGSGTPQYGWQSEDPLVATVTFTENTTAVGVSVPSRPTTQSHEPRLLMTARRAKAAAVVAP